MGIGQSVDSLAYAVITLQELKAHQQQQQQQRVAFEEDEALERHRVAEQEAQQAEVLWSTHSTRKTEVSREVQARLIKEQVRAPVSGSKMFSAHCTLHTAHCTLHTAHCTLHTAHCTLHTAQYPCFCPHTVRSAHCTV